MLDQDQNNTDKRSNFKAYALVMSANFEAVAIFISSYYLSQYLKEHYEVSDNVQKIIYGVALVIIFRSWYVMIKQLIKHEKNKGKK